MGNDSSLMALEIAKSLVSSHDGIKLFDRSAELPPVKTSSMSMDDYWQKEYEFQDRITNKKTDTIFNIYLEFAEKNLGKKTDVIWVSNSTSGHSCLNGINPIIIFSEKYIEYSWFFGLILKTTASKKSDFDKINRLKFNLLRATLLIFSSEALLDIGRSKESIYLLNQALLQFRVIKTYPDFPAIREEIKLNHPVSENLCLWFLCISHEIGHFSSPETPSTARFSKYYNDEIITKAIEDFHTNRLKSKKPKISKKNLEILIDHPVVSFERIKSEIIADTFGLITLFESVLEIQSIFSTGFDRGSFFYNFFTEFGKMVALENFKIRSKSILWGVDEDQDAICYESAFIIRTSILIKVSTELYHLADDGNYYEFDPPPSIDEWYKVAKSFLDPINKSQLSVIKFLDEFKKYESQLGSQLIDIKDYEENYLSSLLSKITIKDRLVLP